MPQLEILNSKFTTKAGEWAYLFLAKDHAKSLSEIKSLDLSGKAIAYVKDLSPFKEMINLKTVDIKDNLELALTQEEIDLVNNQLKAGSP